MSYNRYKQQLDKYTSPTSPDLKIWSLTHPCICKHEPVVHKYVASLFTLNVPIGSPVKNTDINRR